MIRLRKRRGAGATVHLAGALARWVSAGALAAGVLLGPGIDGGVRRAAAQDVERGEQLYTLCAYCHGVDGSGNAEFSAPGIAGLSESYVSNQLRKFRGGVRGKHPDDLEGLRMRPMSKTLRSEEDVDSVAAYVATLPAQQPKSLLSGGDAAQGQALYATCAACHGPDAAGNEALNAPDLRHTGDWYLFAQVRKFKEGVRGADPRDMQGALMRPMAMTLATDQAIRDVVAYIGTLSR